MATIAVAADHLGMSERNFKTLLDTGVIKRADRGNYDLRTVVHSYTKHLREIKQGIEGGGKSKLSDARARKELAHAESAERENEIESGKWVKFEHATAWMIRDIITMKERLLSLSGEMSSVLDTAQCDALDDKIREALTELSTPDTFMQLDKSYNAEARAAKEIKARARKKTEGDKGDDDDQAA